MLHQDREVRVSISFRVLVPEVGVRVGAAALSRNYQGFHQNLRVVLSRGLS
jgi:hypothetical protein